MIRDLNRSALAKVVADACPEANALEQAFIASALLQREIKRSALNWIPGSKHGNLLLYNVKIPKITYKLGRV